MWHLSQPASCEKISFTAMTSCLSCIHTVFDTSRAEKMQKTIQRLLQVRDTQVQGSLLYRQMDSDIRVLNKTIQKIQTMTIGS